MAEKVVIELEIDGSQAGATLGGIKDELIKTGAAAKDTAGASVESLKNQLKQATAEAQELSEKFGATSKQAVAAASRAAELGDKIGDVRDTINALNPDAKFNAIVKVGQGIAGGFAAAQGAMALFGAESENVQKALLKVQSALAISQGINSVRELSDGFKNLGIVVRNTAIYQKALSAAQAAYSFVVGASTGAVKIFRLALASTGIGALIVGIGLLVANWGKLTAFVEKNSEAFKKWGLIIARILFPPINAVILLYQGFQKLGEKFEIVGVVTAKIGEKFAFLKDKIVQLLESVGILSTKEEAAADARVEQSKQREVQIKREIELAKASGATAQELAALEVTLAREKFLAYDQYIKAREKAGRDVTEAERNQFNELADALKISKIEEQKIIDDANKKQQEENKKKWEKIKADRLKAAEEAAKLENDLEDLLITNIADARERELRQLNIGYQRKIEAIKGNSATEIQIRQELLTQERNAVNSLNEKFAEEDRALAAENLQKDYENKNAVLEFQKIETELAGQETFDIEKEQAALKLEQELADTSISNERRLLLHAQHNQAVAAIDKKALEKKKAEEQKLKEIKLAIAKGTIGALNNIADAFVKDEGKRAKIKKALALVELGIDTAIAISGAVKQAQSVQYPGNILAIVTGIAAVAANIAKAKQLLGGGPDVSAASSGGGSSTGGGVTPPRLTSTDSPRTQLLNSERQPPLNVNVTAKVIETDVTESQKRVSSIKDKATI